MNRNNGRMPPLAFVALYLLLLGLLAWKLSGCAGPRPADTASALDGFRALHYSLCVEVEPVNVEACERAYQRLRVLEPSIEDALAVRHGWQRAWTAARPYVEAVGRQLLGMLPGWIGGLVGPVISSRILTRIET